MAFFIHVLRQVNSLDRAVPLNYPYYMRLLLVDNDDSFTRNLEHLLVRVTGTAPVVRPYALFRPEAALAYDCVVISPGPGHPSEYPAYGPLLESGNPVLGVCLGMQVMHQHFNGQISRLPGCVHGAVSPIELWGRTARVARYHSLYVSRVGQGFDVLARCGDVPMACAHRTLPLLGFQFHPESFLTEYGLEFMHGAFDRLLAR